MGTQTDAEKNGEVCLGLTIDSERLVGYLLDQPWHQECSILPKHVAPFDEDKIERCIIQYGSGKYPPRLRHSKGPKQGFFWDVYGDDFQTVELAILALSQAPAPRSVSPVTFTVALDASQEAQAEASS